jgi:hypothetical protein
LLKGFKQEKRIIIAQMPCNNQLNPVDALQLSKKFLGLGDSEFIAILLMVKSAINLFQFKPLQNL